MNRQLFRRIAVGITVALVSLCSQRVRSHSDSHSDSGSSGSEGHVCEVDYGKEPNYYDYDCKSYFSCSDYWGTLHYCSKDEQFHFDHKKCMDDHDVLCKWQLQYYGSSGSSSSSGSSGSSSGSGSSGYERSCHIEYGVEPNYHDDECKSYYNCKDHWGTLFYCPSGYQFDFEHLSCEKDEDVLCKWQLEYYEKYGSSSGSSSGSSGSSSSSGSSDLSSDSRNYSEGHICKTAYGNEPNFDDSEECSTYWSCEDYWGTLQRCHGSDQYHFQYKTCMNDDDVSCWVQMEKYYHGHPYGSGDEDSESHSKTKSCDIAKGQEPNYYDEGCKSYWYCEDYHGTLHECPAHFQFHWDKLDCVKDEDVICEKQQEFYYEHVYYHEVHKGEEEEGSESDHHGSSDSDSDHDSHSGSLNSNNRHRCDVEYGRQADYTSKDCSTYYHCSGYHGTREKCPHGYQFHWNERECLNEEYVDCLRQRDSFPHFEVAERRMK